MPDTPDSDPDGPDGPDGRDDPAESTTDDGPAALRPYDHTRDADALWDLKRDFERSLGDDPAKRARYTAKLDEEYREGWLAWVRRCLEREPCVRVAEDDAATGDDGAGDGPTPGSLVGYAFVLPAAHAYVWDAAVVNELFVAPAHRGTGLADALLGWALEHARGQELPMDRVALDVDRENRRARAFYERHGFEHWGEMVARDL